ncbi:MAG: hypothetical protein ACOCZ6_01975 [Nanoarchaeota archaeon]
MAKKGGFNINLVKILGLIIVVLFAFPIVAGEDIVVFSNYKTTTTLKDDRLHVEREVTIQNLDSNPIIPGELHFRIHELEGGERVPSKIENFRTSNEHGMEMESKEVEGSDETELVVSMWEPILPNFNYNIQMSYDIVFEPQGLLFHELIVPMEDTTVPIKNTENEFHLPSNYHVTYAEEADVRKVEREGEVYSEISWDDERQMSIEYSVLPLPRLGTKAVNIFWGAIIIITLILSFVLHRKLR